MGGKLHTHSTGSVRASPSRACVYPTPEQFAWFEKEVSASGAEWKMPFFHHPLYSLRRTARVPHRITPNTRPMLLKNGVTVVFTGHDHMHERTKPQNGITYFVVGSGGKLRSGGIDSGTGITARGFDTDLALPGRRGRRRSAVFQHYQPLRQLDRFGRDRATEVAGIRRSVFRARAPNLEPRAPNPVTRLSAPKSGLSGWRAGPG